MSDSFYFQSTLGIFRVKIIKSSSCLGFDSLKCAFLAFVVFVTVNTDDRLTKDFS